MIMQKIVKVPDYCAYLSSEKLWNTYCPEVPVEKRRELKGSNDVDCTRITFTWEE